MKIAVLFDGAGLARQGLEQAGHECTGFELNPVAHHLSTFVGSGNCVLADVRDVDLTSYDAIWASPPCQAYSDQNHGQEITGKYKDATLLDWSMQLLDQFPDKVIWVENVVTNPYKQPQWLYNAAQFLEFPLQRRRRMVAGRYPAPHVYRPFQYDYPKMRDTVPPACLASEIGHGGSGRSHEKERRKFTRFYMYTIGRMPTIEDMALAQGFVIPEAWRDQSDKVISQAVGNGVPVYMAKAFGDELSSNTLRS